MVNNIGISVKDRKILWAKAGNRCSYRFEGKICDKELIISQDKKNTITAEEAHIIGPKNGSPRYLENFLNVDSYENRILLCEDCHKIIDDNEEIYTIEVVRNMKKEHEERIAAKLDNKEIIPIIIEDSEFSIYAKDVEKVTGMDIETPTRFSKVKLSITANGVGDLKGIKSRIPMQIFIRDCSKCGCLLPIGGFGLNHFKILCPRCGYEERICIK